MSVGTAVVEIVAAIARLALRGVLNPRTRTPLLSILGWETGKEVLSLLLFKLKERRANFLFGWTTDHAELAVAVSELGVTGVRSQVEIDKYLRRRAAALPGSALARELTRLSSEV